MIDLSGFKANIQQRGIAMGNRYVVTISNAGRLLGEAGGDFTPDEMALCTSVNLPGINFNTFSYKNLSPTIRFVHEVLFEGLSLDFMSFDDGQPYKKFVAWQRAMYGDGMRMEDFAHYAQGIIVKIQEMNRQNKVVESFEYVNCYPTVVTKSLSTESRSTPEKFSVSLAFEYIK